MAKCGLCSTKKGKRYCSPLDKVICPPCCAKNRLIKIDCNEGCRHLEGVNFQQKRLEDKRFSELMSSVGHGQHDDIFQEPAVAFMAFEVESLVRDAYLSGDVRLTDRAVYEAYKMLHAICFQQKQIEGSQLDALTKGLLEQYETNSSAWKANMGEEMIGQVYLRLMISVRKMTGGGWGEHGYLNYVKNNLGQGLSDEEFIVEDRFGNRTRRKINQ
jgi:hypothetical protein